MPQYQIILESEEPLSDQEFKAKLQTHNTFFAEENEGVVLDGSRFKLVEARRLDP
jgi:hypothetical protein